MVDHTENMSVPITIKESLTEGEGYDLRPSANWRSLSMLVDTEKDRRDLQDWEEGGVGPRDPEITKHRLDNLASIVTMFVADGVVESGKPGIIVDDVVEVAGRFADQIVPPVREDERAQFIGYVVTNLRVALDAIRARSEEHGSVKAFYHLLDTDPTFEEVLRRSIEHPSVILPPKDEPETDKPSSDIQTVEGTAPPYDGPVSNECFYARLMRLSHDVLPSSIPEDFAGVNFEGHGCAYKSEDGTECTFADPMVFLVHNVGLTSIGATNFCRLEMDSPGEFKKAALGGLTTRVARSGKHAFDRFKQKFIK